MLNKREQWLWLITIITEAALLMWPIEVFGEEKLVSQMAEVSKSVGALYAQSESGDLSFNCSGTAVERKDSGIVFLTAYHCFTKGKSYMVSFDGRTFHHASVLSIPRYHVDDKKYSKKFGEPDTDMAMFLVQVQGVPIVPLGDDGKLAIGHRIVVVGYPLGVAKIGYEGIIAGRMNRPGSDWHGYLLLQSFGAPGSSGSSVVDRDTGTVIGILVGARQGFTGLPVIFATPISYRQYLMEVPGLDKKER
jgi:V8-like Glu-specific endopeptidase